jgi:hypothetical protein
MRVNINSLPHLEQGGRRLLPNLNSRGSVTVRINEHFRDENSQSIPHNADSVTEAARRYIGMTEGWSRKFDEPITVAPRGPRGRSRTLVTLKDAGDYVTRLPKVEHSASEWQAAMLALMLAARGGPVMLARIGMMRALNREH